VSSLFAFLLLVRAAATENDDPGDDCMRVFISGEGLALGLLSLFLGSLDGFSSVIAVHGDLATGCVNQVEMKGSRIFVPIKYEIQSGSAV
jgi:hypothetical protein